MAEAPHRSSPAFNFKLAITQMVQRNVGPLLKGARHDPGTVAAD